MTKRKRSRKSGGTDLAVPKDLSDETLAGWLESRPDVFDPTGDGCDEETLTELEQELGGELPEPLPSLLRVSDGGIIHGPAQSLYLASIEDYLSWKEEGITDDLGTVPFAHDGETSVLVLDPEGNWGSPAGGVYRVMVGQRAIRGFPIQDAVRIADSLPSLVRHLVDGQRAF